MQKGWQAMHFHWVYSQDLCEISPGTLDLSTDAPVAQLPDPAFANSSLFVQTTPTSSFRPLTGGGEQESLQPLRSPERRSPSSDWRSAVWAVPKAGLPRCGNVSTSTRGFSLESRHRRAGVAEPVFRLSRGGGPTLLGPDPGVDPGHRPPGLSSWTVYPKGAWRRGAPEPGRGARGPSPPVARMGGGGRRDLGCSV